MTPSVDDTGLHLPDGAPKEPLDVVLGDHRVWSFTLGHDGAPEPEGTFVAWPAALARVLDGVASVTVVPHNGGDAVFAGEVRFGTSDQPLELVDDAGHPLSLDKGNRLQRTFDRMDDAARRELVEATRRVLDDLVEECGMQAYLAYGCLLGAVRDGHMIGHDSDADLAFYSPHTHPYDVIRETRAAEQRLRDLGWTVVRMSAANFKVWVPLPTGKRAGIDVFGSFHVGDQFHLMGSLRGVLAREAVVPFGKIELEGVEFPAPHDLEAFLAYTYGPSWRVPDPAFHFDHPPENTALMSQWFRGSRRGLWYWSEFYGSPARRRVPDAPSEFAAWAASRMEPGSRVVELGAGTGRDTFFLTDQGFRVTGTDFAGAAVKLARSTARARRENGDRWVGFRGLNLEADHNWLTRGARYAHEPGVKHVYGRLLVDTISADARHNLWRFCSMLGRSGGHTFLEVGTGPAGHEPGSFGDYPRTDTVPVALIAEAAAYGGRVVEREDVHDRACRLELAWTSTQDHAGGPR